MNLAELKKVQLSRTNGQSILVPTLNGENTDRVLSYPCSETHGPKPVGFTEVYRAAFLGEASRVELDQAYRKAYAFWKRHYG